MKNFIFIVLMIFSSNLFSQDGYKIRDSTNGKVIFLPKNSFGIINCDKVPRGTGIIINKPNYVITCAHVLVTIPAKEYTIYTENGYHKLEVVVLDTLDDLALLKSKENICEKPLEAQNMQAMKCGDYIAYIGYAPSMRKEKDVAEVMVNNTLIKSKGKMSHFKTVLDFIEFDTSGEPGYSGGPIIDENTGKVFAIFREGYYLSLKNCGCGSHIGRAISFSKLLAYIK